MNKLLPQLSSKVLWRFQDTAISAAGRLRSLRLDKAVRPARLPTSLLVQISG